MEAAYNVLNRSGNYLAPFIRYENFDTQAAVASGFSRDKANHRTTLTTGVTYKPLSSVVIKLDYQFRSNDKDGVGSGLEDQYSMGVGYMF